MSLSRPRLASGASFFGARLFRNPIQFIEISFAFSCSFALIIDGTSSRGALAGFEVNSSQESGEALPEFLERLE